MERYEVVPNVDVPAGKVELKCHFVNDTKILDSPASGTLFIQGEQVGTGKIEKQVRLDFGDGTDLSPKKRSTSNWPWISHVPLRLSDNPLK
jgi:hypothetical protein